MGWSFSNVYNNVFGKSEEPKPAAPPEPGLGSKIAGAASSAWTWTKDTAAPAVGNGALWVAAISPVGALANLAGADWARERQQAFSDGAINLGKYAVNNPGRAGALATQGVVNGVTSVVGLVGDLGRSVVWDWTTRNAVNLAISSYNLGADKDSKAGKVELGDFGRWSDALNGTFQIRNAFPESWTGARVAFDRVQPKLPDGRDNPNATSERILLYGPQAMVEIPAFVFVTSVTAGAAGAAWATARGGAAAFKHSRTVSTVVGASDEAAAAGKVTAATTASATSTSTAAATSTAGTAGTTAGVTTGSGAAATTTASTTSTAGVAAGTTTANVAGNGAAAASTASTTAATTAGTTAQSGGLAALQEARIAQKMAEATEKLEKAQQTLATARTAPAGETAAQATAHAQDLKKAEKAVTRAEKNLALVEKDAAAAPRFFDLPLLPGSGFTMTGSQGTGTLANAFNQFEFRYLQTSRFFDHRYGGRLGTGLEFGGAGLSFGMGVYTDIKKGEEEVAGSQGIVTGAQGENADADQAEFERSLQRNGATPAQSADPVIILDPSAPASPSPSNNTAPAPAAPPPLAEDPVINLEEMGTKPPDVRSEFRDSTTAGSVAANTGSATDLTASGGGTSRTFGLRAEGLAITLPPDAQIDLSANDPKFVVNANAPKA